MDAGPMRIFEHGEIFEPDFFGSVCHIPYLVRKNSKNGENMGPTRILSNKKIVSDKNSRKNNWKFHNLQQSVFRKPTLNSAHATS